MAALCCSLLEGAAFQQHVAAILHNSSLLASLFEELLPALQTLAAFLQLPTEQRMARYPNLRWTDAGHMAALLAHTGLRSRLKAYLTAGSDSSGIGSSAARLLQTACQLAMQAPQQLPANGADNEEALCGFADLASQMLSQLADIVRQQQRQGCWRWGERPQRAAQTLLAALPGMASVLRAQHAVLVETATLPDKVNCSLGRCLLMAASLLQALALTEGGQAGSPFSSQAAAVQWCDAASAALSMLPAATELAEQAATSATLLDALPSSLLNAAASIAIGAGSLSVRQPASSPAGSTACPDFPPALFQLHTAACRATHWVAARPRPEPTLPSPVLLVWPLDAPMAVVARLCKGKEPQQEPFAAAMAAAHWEAVQALARVSQGEPRAQRVLEQGPTVAALAAAAALCPAAAALHPAPLARLDSGLARLRQVRHRAAGSRA